MDDGDSGERTPLTVVQGVHEMVKIARQPIDPVQGFRPFNAFWDVPANNPFVDDNEYRQAFGERVQIILELLMARPDVRGDICTHIMRKRGISGRLEDVKEPHILNYIQHVFKDAVDMMAATDLQLGYSEPEMIDEAMIACLKDCTDEVLRDRGVEGANRDRLYTEEDLMHSYPANDACWDKGSQDKAVLERYEQLLEALSDKDKTDLAAYAKNKMSLAGKLKVAKEKKVQQTIDNAILVFAMEDVDFGESGEVDREALVEWLKQTIDDIVQVEKEDSIKR